jgi:methanogenic corrinoid protein MtbC1
MKDLRKMEDRIIELVKQLEEERVKKLVDIALKEGVEPLHLLELIAEGMTRVGKLYESKDYYIADLIMAGMIFKDVLKSDSMTANFHSTNAGWVGKVIIGTVEGDIHDIGKDIFKGMLEATGFEVIDLGVDVPKELFVQKFREYKPDIIGLSGVLTNTLDPMKEVVNAFVEAGIREEVKFIVGGNHLNAGTCQYIGADDFSNDVSKGIKVCKEWVGSTYKRSKNND